mmetsp:Transcript_29562/g.42293  ORF Transcript_29562/g.42293 Transcript_29562/m.42293 type:complete len:314 (+) Transcript_29562:231-1172(+)
MKGKGFAAVLGLDSESLLQQIQSGELAIDKSRKVLTYRYKIPEHLCDSNDETKSKIFPLSGFLSLFDELTTLAILADESSGNRPGVSTSLYAELGPAGLRRRGILTGDEVEIKASIIRLGQNIAFTKAEVIDIVSGDVVCFGRHTKYLPGNIVQDALLRNAMPLLVKYASMKNNPTHEIETKPLLRDLLALSPLSHSSMDQETNEDDARMTFTLQDIHKNGFGSLHGGMQAMVMESFGRKQIEKDLKCKAPTLFSINVSYFSSAKEDVVIDGKTNNIETAGSSMTVKLSRLGDKKILSEGFLQWRHNIMQSKI